LFQLFFVHGFFFFFSEKSLNICKNNRKTRFFNAFAGFLFNALAGCLFDALAGFCFSIYLFYFIFCSSLLSLFILILVLARRRAARKLALKLESSKG
jgi:hypothetical protein